MSRTPFPLALVAASCLGAGAAGAIGIGGVQSEVVLGQPLDVTVPVQLADGETLEAGCVSADVHVGETRLGPDQVAAVVRRPVGGAQALVRVRSRAGIDEPVVSLTLVAGCPARVTRRFVLFADPPELQAARGAALDPAMPAPVLPDAQAVAAIAPAPASATPPVAEAAEVPASAPRPASAPLPARKTRSAKSTAVAAAARPGATPPRRPAQAQAAPRLQLEPMALPSPPEDPRLPAAQEAARAAAAAAAAARQQAAEAQAELARLRLATAADRETLVTLRAQMADAEAQAGSMQMLGAAMAAAMAGLAVLAWRLRRRRQNAQPAWWAAGQTPVAATPQPGPSTTAADADGDEAWDDPPAHAMRPPLPVKTVESPALDVPVTASAPASVPPTELSPAPWVVVPATPRDLPALRATIGSPAPAPAVEPIAPEPAVAQRQARACEWALDEDADLEQRADFFVVLGLDDDAADLLRTHLERTGGGCAMAYLKLLEIHRRRGDRAAYERTASQFTEHFNVRPPAWEGDADTGRGLDETPGLLAGIERRWHDPRDAVDGLESLLWRRADGAPALSLAAFEDALLLCQVALRRQQPEVAGSQPGPAAADARTPAMAAGGGGLAFGPPWTADEPAGVERIELAFERADGAAAVRAPLAVR